MRITYVRSLWQRWFVEQLAVASSVAKHIPVYNVRVEHFNTQGEIKTLELSSPFTRWFDANGLFVAKPFQQWLASEIPLVGQVDPRHNGCNANIAASANGRSEVVKPVSQKKYDTSKGSTSSDAAPLSTRSKRGKRWYYCTRKLYIHGWNRHQISAYVLELGIRRFVWKQNHAHAQTSSLDEQLLVVPTFAHPSSSSRHRSNHVLRPILYEIDSPPTLRKP